MSSRLRLVLLFAALLSAQLEPARSQTGDTTAGKRVTVAMNADGSRTSYEFDPANRKAVATTTSAAGKALGKILYVLDDAGRFVSGEVLGANGKFLYKTSYKHDAAGQLQEEIRLTKEDAVTMKLVYSYDSNGKQAGYSVFDGSGKLLGKTTPKAPASAKAEKKSR